DGGGQGVRSQVRRGDRRARNLSAVALAAGQLPNTGRSLWGWPGRGTGGGVAGRAERDAPVHDEDLGGAGERDGDGRDAAHRRDVDAGRRQRRSTADGIDAAAG